MPIYEYRCADCGKTFDAIQKFSDEPYTNCGQSASLECPTKGKGHVSRLMSTPSFHLKGTGWYVTDYKKGGSSSSSSSSSATESKSESKTETKSETTPAKSSESTPSAPASPTKAD